MKDHDDTLVPQIPNIRHSRRILIVDDEPDNIRILAEMLTGNYKFCAATSGEEGLEHAFSQEKPDLILLDIIMPGMNGYEVLAELKANKKTRHIPVICVTVMGRDTDELRGFELGAVDYITRPFSAATVNARVKAHLELSQYRGHLERMVHERTRRIRKEIRERRRAEERLRLQMGREIEMEKQLRQARKMEAIGTLAGGISHDFNNLLYIMLGHAEMAADHSPRDGIALRCIEQIIRAGRRGAELVRQILSFSRQGEQERHPIRIQPVLKETLKLLGGSLPSAIRIRQDIDEKCGHILGDTVRIHQIVMNLCTNAYHAMRDKGGVLDIRLAESDHAGTQSPANACPLSDSTRGPAKYVHLTVKNSGHGMDEATMSKIFDPYFTSKEIGDGTGLGLSTVYSIVREYGGSICVDSLPGEGSTFHIFFPMCESANPVVSEPEDSRPPKPARCAGTVLITDDEDRQDERNEA